MSGWDLGPLVSPVPSAMLSMSPTPSQQQPAHMHAADAVVAAAASAGVLAIAWQSGRIEVLTVPACTPAGVLLLHVLLRSMKMR